jgi:hypothetical protein
MIKQYSKITKSIVPSWIYSHTDTVSENKLNLDKIYMGKSNVPVAFYYIDYNNDYIIFSKNKTEVLNRIYCFINNYF